MNRSECNLFPTFCIFSLHKSKLVPSWADPNFSVSKASETFQILHNLDLAHFCESSGILLNWACGEKIAEQCVAVWDSSWIEFEFVGLLRCSFLYASVKPFEDSFESAQWRKVKQLHCSFLKGRMAIGGTASESLRISIFLNNISHLRRQYICFFSHSSTVDYFPENWIGGWSLANWMGIIFGTLDGGLSFQHWIGVYLLNIGLEVIFGKLDGDYLACDKSARIGMEADS